MLVSRMELLDLAGGSLLGLLASKQSSMPPGPAVVFVPILIAFLTGEWTDGMGWLLDVVKKVILSTFAALKNIISKIKQTKDPKKVILETFAALTNISNSFKQLKDQKKVIIEKFAALKNIINNVKRAKYPKKFIEATFAGLKNIINKIQLHTMSWMMPARKHTRTNHYNLIHSNSIKRYRKSRKEKHQNITRIANKIKQQKKPDELANDISNVQLAKGSATTKPTVLTKRECESPLENTIVNTTGKSINIVENSPSCLNCFGVEKHLMRCGGCWYV